MTKKAMPNTVANGIQSNFALSVHATMNDARAHPKRPMYKSRRSIEDASRKAPSVDAPNTFIFSTAVIYNNAMQPAIFNIALFCCIGWFVFAGILFPLRRK